MSAVTITMQQDRIIVLTDAAIYDTRNGNLLALTPKCFGLPGVAAAITSRGCADVPVVFGQCCETLGIGDCSWDDFVRLHLKSVLASFDQAMQHRALRGEVFLVGWSVARQCGEVFYWQNHGHMTGGLKPSTPYLFPTGDVAYHLPHGTHLADLGEAATYAPEVDGVRAFEAARQRVEDVSFGREAEPVIAHSVGGWIDETIISAAGAAHRRLHTWPEDMVGTPISPASALAAAA